MNSIYKSFWAMSLCLLWSFLSFGQYEQVISNSDYGFGSSISVSGNRALISSPDEDTLKGAVYFYEYSDNGWIEKQRITGEISYPFVRYGQSVALDGDWAVVGDRNGSAYFYHFEDNQWVLNKHIFRELTGFGFQVALLGNKAIVSDIYNNSGGSGVGVTYYYEQTGDTWEEKQAIIPSDSTVDGFFGGSLSIGQNRLAIGSQNEDIIYYYEFDGVAWQEIQVIRDSANIPISGNTLAFHGDWLVTGGKTCQVFQYLNGQFQLFQTIESPFEPQLNSADYRISVSDNALAIGNRGQDSFKGVVYVYQFNGNTWGNLQTMSYNLLRPQFGSNVVVIGNKIWIVSRYLKSVFISQLPSSYFINTLSPTGEGSISALISEAPSGAEISFSSALTGDTIHLDSGSINISKDIKLIAPPNITVVLDGNSSNSIFEIDSTAALYIEGITFQHANSSAILNHGNLELFNCTFRNNEATNGGAIYNHGTLCVESSTFYDNTSSQLGGALFQGNGISHIKNSTFTRNSAQNGGALAIDSLGHSSINSSTISRNVSDISGGGIYNLGQVSTNNTILAGNTASNHPDIYAFNPVTSRGYNLLGEIYQNQFNGMQNSDIWGTLSEPIDPLLGILKNNGGLTKTMALRPNSPALGQGDSDTLIYDQRGVLRATPTNIGAVDGITHCDESSGMVVNVFDSGPGSLRQIIAEAEDGDTIRFAECVLGDTILLDGGFISIDKNLTIWGPGHDKLCLNANYLNRIFTIRSDLDVQIRGLSLIRGYESNGGAISKEINSRLQINACNFSENNAFNGRAIYGPNDGQVKIDSCFFVQNRAPRNDNRVFQSSLIYADDVSINHAYFEGQDGGDMTSDAAIVRSRNSHSKCFVKNSTFF